jgi:hypothetical protein
LIEPGNIASVKKVKDSFEPDADCFKGSPLKSSSNILFTFVEPVNIERIYRKTKPTKQLLMTIDDAEQFISLIHQHAD